jgi:hypothetical protein
MVASLLHGFGTGVVLGLRYGLREALLSGARWLGWRKVL